MKELRDAYAPPRGNGPKPRDNRTATGPRVVGSTRVLAALLELMPFVAFAAWRGLVDHTAADLTAYRVSTIYYFAWLLVALACETAFAASPGMLLIGLRVRRADGTEAMTGRLAAKAALVRVPQLPLLPGIFANLLMSLVPSLATTDLTLVAGTIEPLASVEAFLWFAWLVGYLFAFGKPRQTHVDHMLGLAVYRQRDLL